MENEVVAPLKLNFTEEILMIYLTDVTKKLNILFLKFSTINIKAACLPWKSVQLNSMT